MGGGGGGIIGNTARHISGLFGFLVYICCLFQLQLRPENAEEFIEYLIRIGRLDEAAVKLADIVNDVNHSLPSIQSTH